MTAADSASEIAQLGDPVLRQVAPPVLDPQAPEVRRVVEQMLASALQANGVGIAAPQLSVSARIFIVASRPTLRYPDAPEMTPTPMVNPQLLGQSDEREPGWEGCLSVPGLRGIVLRSRAIEVAYRDLDGRYHRRELAGFVARIFQHELDHLDGALFVDRVASTRDLYTEREYLRRVDCVLDSDGDATGDRQPAS